MKTKLLGLAFLLVGALSVNILRAENEKRDVPSFSEISMRISGTVYLKQGSEQRVEIDAREATLKEIITEVKDRKLIIRFPAQDFFKRSFDPGPITIRITVPEVDGLSVSGSGDIRAENTIKTRILDLNVSGSGNIILSELNSERVLAAISGSGNISVKDGGPADELSVSISGSGNMKAQDFEAKTVEVKISGSGNCSVFSNGTIRAKIAGSGNVYYSGNPSVESSVAGSGSVKEAR